MKAVVFTLGCKVNEYESDALIAGLIKKGYTVSDKLEYADLYIVNTCAVTSEAEKKSRQMASRIKKFNKDAKIIFTGCACQNNPSAFSKKSSDYLVTGVFNKSKILECLDDCGEKIEDSTINYEELPFAKTLRTRSFIKVQDGCDNFCSYCIIPYLRGRNRSRRVESIIEEVKNLQSSEVVLTGINLSAYNYNGTNLAGLINAINFTDKRIRLGSLETSVIDEELLIALKGLKNFAPHFHLSLQSGSDNVLKKMNRHYSAKTYIEKVDLIRTYFPLAGITTDIIVGFPTETEQDFLETLRLADRVNFSDIHPFIFSPRKGTVAYKMPDIDYEIKKKRLDILIEKKRELKEKFANLLFGKTLMFIPEEEKDGYTVGYSENYLRLYLKDKNIKESVNVIVKEPYLDGALCEIKN